MTIRFHISDDLLLSYASGNMDEASSLLVASHLALCPHCRIRKRGADFLADICWIQFLKRKFLHPCWTP